MGTKNGKLSQHKKNEKVIKFIDDKGRNERGKLGWKKRKINKILRREISHKQLTIGEGYITRRMAKSVRLKKLRKTLYNLNH